MLSTSVKANGKLSPRVHKLKQLSLSKGEKVVVSKRHVLKADATTYTLYPGTHRVTLQINGKSLGHGHLKSCSYLSVNRYSKSAVGRSVFDYIAEFGVGRTFIESRSRLPSRLGGLHQTGLFLSVFD